MKYTRSGVSTMTALIAVLVVLLIAAAAAYTAMFAGWGGKSPTSSGTLALTAGGSTFVNPVMQVWASGFHNTTVSWPQQVTINYAAVGSGVGQQGIFAETFDFAGSDAPVAASQLTNFASRGPLLQIPETLGGIAIFYNIQGVTTSLNLNGTVLARIYLGLITTWNDPAIAQLNPGVSLPSTAIVPVHRSDGSGTTFALTSYLNDVYPGWRKAVGVGTQVNWPKSELAGSGSSGVAGLVSQNDGAIGYADQYYAFTNHLLSAKMENSHHSFLAPTLDSIAAAAADFSAALQSNATTSIVNAPGPNSYPIATFTYLLVWQNQTNQPKAQAIAKFFGWIVTSGQAYGPSRYYPALPASMVTIDQQLIARINYNGRTFT